MVNTSQSHQSNIGIQAGDVSGLTTNEALIRLRNGVETVINKYKSERSRWKWISNAICHSNESSLFCWISMVVLLLCSIILIIISFINDNNFRYEYVGFYGTLLLILVSGNMVFVLWDSYLCYNEILMSLQQLLEYISEITPICNWKRENYPHLCSPYSPCITLQWAYRDGCLVNLPWSLLVEGDLVLIKPGQPAPGRCVPIAGDSPELEAGQVYSPVPQDGQLGGVGGAGGCGKLSARSPLSNKLYKMHETPYLRNLQLLLKDSDSASRTVTYHNHARQLLMDNCVEQLALPLLLVSIICVNAMRYIYLKHWVGYGSWLDMFVIIPICVILPLLPLVFPIFWILLSCYGNTVIAAALLQKTNNTDNKKEHSDPFEDIDFVEKGSNIMETKLPFRMRWHLFIEILLGRQKHSLIRSANLLHVLGSVTSLCCVDKKGILSWPNPTAEKIFFLRKPDTPSCSSQVDSQPRNETEVEPGGGRSSSAATTDLLNVENIHHNDNNREINEIINENELKPYNSRPSAPHSHAESSSGHMQAEVLDLTHDHSCPFKLEFDDAAWKRHLLSLKPLGLAILLNTCNMDTQEHYTQFCSHVTCEALYNEDLVPITNRRCLCEVAKQIGFSEAATEIFRLESQLSTFRHVQPESVRNDMRFARSLPPSTKLKFPFPHMVAVIMKEKTKNGGLQLFSQGTADIILDCCVEYWDGNKLCKLSTADRRKVQDFYQRTSLSAYCTAFAYRPLFRGAAHWLSDIYMELPMDGQTLHAPSPLPGAFSQFQSTDSLITGEMQEPDVDDIEGCFKLQSNQVFIGMVTMQYQAQADIVQLIEQLEGACIRFVHFSKENELRSRVFSEKVGLESGWNCHISLLSDNNLLSSQSIIDPDQAITVDDFIDTNICDITEFGCEVVQSNDGNFQSFLVKGASNILFSDKPRQKSYSSPCLMTNDSLNEQLVPFLSVNKTVNSVGADYIADYIRGVTDDIPADNDSVLIQQQQNAPGDWQSQSLSCLTDSTEQSVPVNFDMSNRAKLPRGIENIRPHLEMVDNVPLLVSLFTDCTPTTTREMISIMQDYGEVVCVIGSSANADNVGIFIQANASIAVEPLYPQVCQKVSVCKPTDPDFQGPSPIHVSRLLNSIPCSVTINREDSFSIFHLITKARHYMKQVWNCTQYWVCCVVSLSCAQLLASLLMLPPLFSTGHVIWLSVVVIPLLSLSLVSSSPDPQIMKRATDKKASAINTEMALFVLWCYGSKFLWSVCLIPVVFGAILSSFCENLSDMKSPVSESRTQTAPLLNEISNFFDDGNDENEAPDQCSIVYPLVIQNGDNIYSTWGGWSNYAYALLSVQHVMVFLLTIHYITISVSFVHRDYLCWHKSPHRSKVWLILLFIVFFIQIFYTVMGVVSISLMPSSYNITNTTSGTANSVDKTEFMLDLWEDIPLAIIASIFVSPIVVFIINEFVKWEEIKANVRYQKRARLEFGTKLGMNSPF